jgi:putative ABC transport system permease protein
VPGTRHRSRLGIRLTARHPRRAVLSAASIAITVAAIVAVLCYHAHIADGSSAGPGLSALANPRTERVNQVMLIITAALIILAAVNAIVITWATALDARRPSALARALGATPEQTGSGLSAAQLLPAVPGALAGVPAGIGLYTTVSGQSLLIPPAAWLALAVAGTLLTITTLTVIPAMADARRPVAEILQTESA